MNARNVTAALLALALSARASRSNAQHRHTSPQPAQPAQPTQPASPTQPAAAAQTPDATQAAAALEAEHVRGVEMRRQHRDAEARDLFRELYERTHEPRVLAWLAGAEGALGDWVSAETHLSTALAATNDPWISQLRDELVSDLAGFRQRLGLLEIISTTPGAQVILSGVATPLPLERPMTVRAGDVTVEVRAEGYLPEVRTIQVAPGMRTPARETVNLTQRPPEPPPGTTPAVTHTTTVVEVQTGIPPLRIVGAVLAGVGAVGLGIGIYGMVHYSSQRDDYVNAGCDVSNPPADCAGFDPSGSLTLGIASLSAGGLLVAGGLTLLLIPLNSSRRAPASGLSLGAGPGELGLSLRGAF